MTDAKLKDALDDFDKLLTEERGALLDGDLERVAALLDRKETLIATIAALEPRAGEIAPLQTQLRRNQELFDQALAGIRVVAERIGRIREIRRSLDTYDSQGQRQTIEGTVGRTLERRA